MSTSSAPRFDQATLDDIRLRRSGRASPRQVHEVNTCACGAQAWTTANRASVIMVSIEDYRLIVDFWWDVRWTGRSAYAYSPTAKKYLGVSDNIHRVIAAFALVDHVDRNGLNNMRSNLRPSSKKLNGANSRARTHSCGPHKGVRLDTRPLKNRWEARITVDGRSTSLGRFRTAVDAARAYDAAARKAFGSHARLNFPNPGEAGV